MKKMVKWVTAKTGEQLFGLTAKTLNKMAASGIVTTTTAGGSPNGATLYNANEIYEWMTEKTETE